MRMTKKQIINDITNYLTQCGIKTWNEVYVGIAEDPRDRLFNGHRVNKESGIYIACEAFSSQDAREVEKTLLAQGADGGPGGGDDDTTCVYAYKKTPYTVDC